MAKIHFWKVNTGFGLALLVLMAGGCGKPEHYKVLAGATVVTEKGARPIADAVVVLNGPKIDRVGPVSSTFIPKSADRTELTGRWIVPVRGGRIEEGADANLLVLDHAPAGAEPAKDEDVGAKLVLGEWKMPGK